MNDVAKKATARDLLDAWRRADERARSLRSRLQHVASRANRYRSRLVELAKVTRVRKHQTTRLRERLLEALESRAPAAPPAPPDLPSELESFRGEHVPVEWLRHLLTRLNQAQGMLQEYETLLAFRENQVHELLEKVPEQAPELANEPQVMRLARDLAQSRNRIRLLTLELMRSGQSSSLEGKLQEAQAALATSEARVEKLEDVMRTRIGELQKASANLTTAKQRLGALEEELAREREARAQLTREYETLNQRHQALLKQHLELEASHQALEETHLDLEDRLEATQGGNPERAARLEAAVVELRSKLQLVSARYTEVKDALQARQAQLVEAQKKADFLVPLVQTLETALDESRKRAEELSRERTRASIEWPGEDKLEEMESKLREARRTAVRAQTEAAAKRREATRLEGEVENLKSELEQVRERSAKLEELARAQARKLKEITGRP